MIANFRNLLLLICISNALYQDNPMITNLNDGNFEKLVKNDGGIWIIEFFVPWCGHCRNFAPKYVTIASTLKGLIKAGAVNSDENPKLTQEYRILAYPTIKFFNTHKGSVLDYSKERTVEAIVSEANILINNKASVILNEVFNFTMFKSSGVIELTEKNFETEVFGSKKMWLVVFYTPFHEDSRILAHEWSKAVAELTNLINLAAVEASMDIALASKCKMADYPGIIFFPAGPKGYDSGQRYPGPLHWNGITRWTFERISQDYSPKLAQITSSESLKTSCKNKPLCVVSFLPHILDCQSGCRNDYLQMLETMAGAFRKYVWGWVWSEAGAQPKVEAALGVGGFGYPALVAVSVKEMKYKVFVGAFRLESVEKFLEELARSKAETFMLNLEKLPEIHAIEAWDGLDGELPVEVKDEL